MSDTPAIACPHCGKRYAMTPEYIARYGGRETTCAKCGNAMLLPATWEEIVPPVEAAAVAVADAPAGPALLSYAAPDITPMATDGVWRDADATVVIAKGAKLPVRCFICATPTDLPAVDVSLSWVNPKKKRKLPFLLIFFGWFVAMLSYYSSAETVRLNLCRCPQHRTPRHLRRIGVVVCALSLPVWAVGRSYPETNLQIGLAILALAMVFSGLVLLLIPFRLRVAHIEKGYAWIEGFPKAFQRRCRRWPKRAPGRSKRKLKGLLS